MKNILVTTVYNLLIRPWLTLIIGVSFQNRNTFDFIDQFIVVANHNSHFDTVAIMAALPGKALKKTSAVAAGDYFGKTSITAAAMNFFFNAILINRNRNEGEASAIEILDKHLKNKKSLILFPEGSRGKAGVMTDFKKGIAILLKNNPTVPFIPVYLDGFGRVLPKDKKLIIPFVCKVRFGKPLFPKNENVESILEEVRDAILRLKRADERDRNQFEIQ